MALVAADCPSCGAGIQIPDDRDTVHCMYCGQKILIERSDQPAPKPESTSPSNPLEFKVVIEINVTRALRQKGGLFKTNYYEYPEETPVVGRVQITDMVSHAILISDVVYKGVMKLVGREYWLEDTEVRDALNRVGTPGGKSIEELAEIDSWREATVLAEKVVQWVARFLGRDVNFSNYALITSKRQDQLQEILVDFAKTAKAATGDWRRALELDQKVRITLYDEDAVGSHVETIYEEVLT